MIYVEMTGRLGNQLFYYAIARKIQITNKNSDRLCFCFYDIVRAAKKNPDMLGLDDSLQYFNTVEYMIDNRFYSTLKNENAGKIQNQILKFNSAVQLFYRSKKHKIFKKKILTKLDRLTMRFGGYFYPAEMSEEDICFIPSMDNIKNIFVRGRYENPKWFDDIKEVLLEELTPKEKPMEENRDLYKIIKNTESVCVSIRRGDYLAKKNKDIFYVCDEEYFMQAVKKVKELIAEPTWIIFSDDIDWVKNSELFRGENKVYYESGQDPVWEKLRLMYSCKHFIISNSTFSWWAQYLSRNKNKIVVSPNIWFQPDQVWPLIDDSFVKIDVKKELGE